MTDVNEYASMIQNIKVSVNLGRDSLFDLGRKGPYHRYVNFPVETKDFMYVDISSVASITMKDGRKFDFPEQKEEYFKYEKELDEKKYVAYTIPGVQKLPDQETVNAVIKNGWLESGMQDTAMQKNGVAENKDWPVDTEEKKVNFREFL